MTTVRIAYPAQPLQPVLHPPIDLTTWRPYSRLDLDRRIDFAAITLGNLPSSLVPSVGGRAFCGAWRRVLGMRSPSGVGLGGLGSGQHGFPTKRPIREIVGVDPRLNRRWSTRRADIDARRGELAIQFQNDHGRPPTPVEALRLAQQATLETRDAKHEPRSLAEQRDTWLSEAVAVLGGSEALASMVRTALAPHAETATIADARWVAQTADHILTVMEASRSTWQMWHVRAEAQRQVRTIDMPAEQATALVDLLVDEVLDHRSVALPTEGCALLPSIGLRTATAGPSPTSASTAT